MAAYTSTRSGDWSDPATWGGSSGTPGAADDVTVAAPHTVTISAPASANTVAISYSYDGATNPNAHLVVNSSLDLMATTGTALSYTALSTTDGPSLVLGPGGSIVGHPASGQSVAFQMGNGNFNPGAWAANGTGWGAGQFCEVKNAGAGSLAITSGGYDGSNFAGSYVKFTGLASVDAGHLETAFAHSGWVADHVRFSGCGKFSIICEASIPFRFDDVQFSGTTDPTYSASLTIVAPNSGVERTHSVVSYDKRLSFTGAGLGFSTSYFGGDLENPGAGTTWTGFDSCLLARDATISTDCAGPVSGSYFVFPGTPDNPHFIQNVLTGAGGGWSVTDSIFEAPQLSSAFTDMGDLVFGPDGPLTLTGNIAVPVSLGSYAGYAPGVFCSNGGTANTSITCEHNTIVGRQGAPYYGETYAGHAGMYASLRSNLVVNLSGTPDGYKFTITHGSTVADGVVAANANHNGGFGLLAGSLGDGYNYPSTTGTPGASDVDANPALVDATRNIATWGATQGSDGTVAGALAILAANPALISQSTTGLVPWVRAGFAPTNAAFHGTAHDGTDIGAIAYQAGGPPAFTVATPSATVAGPHEVELSWAAATGGTAPYSYQLRRAPDAFGSAGTYADLGPPGTGLAYSDAQLDPGVIYHYQVAVTDSAAATATSAEVVATTTLPDIPNYALWWSRMVSFLPAFNATMAANPGFNDGYINHDGAYGAIQALAGYRPGNADLTAFLGYQLQDYRDAYVMPSNGSVAGYYVFPEGLGLDWERNGSTASRDALIAIRTNASFVPDTAFAENNLIYAGLSRETAYALLTHTEADRLGLVAWDQPWVTRLVDDALGHIAQWLGDPAVWSSENSTFIQPFMMGITGIALGKYLDYIEASKATTDARILPALAALAVRMRGRWWRPTSGDFVWPIYPDMVDATPGADNTVLNLESTNFFGWLYHRTGSDYFKTAGDEAFSSGIASAQIYAPKQWNQQYRWSFLYVGWRLATPRSDDDFYVLDAPPIPRGNAGQESDTFVVVPLRGFTGTITPSDGGAGGVFSPSVLTFAGGRAPATFTYTPAAAGTVTISCSNDGGLADPAPVAFTATATARPRRLLLPPRRAR